VGAYNRRFGILIETPVEHEPWPLAAGVVEELTETLVTATGLPTPTVTLWFTSRPESATSTSGPHAPSSAAFGTEAGTALIQQTRTDAPSLAIAPGHYHSQESSEQDVHWVHEVMLLLDETEV
jgi:hypothetical protein